MTSIIQDNREAVEQLCRRFRVPRRTPKTAARIAEHQRIISLRNILIHGYAEIDDRLVWGILQSKLPDLLEQVESLLDDG